MIFSRQEEPIRLLSSIKLILISAIISILVIIGGGAILLYIDHVFNIFDIAKMAKTNSYSPSFILSYSLINVLLAGVAILLWQRVLYKIVRHKTEPRIKNDTTLRTYIYYIVFAIMFSIMMNLINTSIFDLPKITEWQEQLVQNSSSSANNVILVFIATVILAPIWEEIVFRGILFSSLATLRAPIVSITATSLCWSLSHYQQYNAIIISEIFIIGLVLGYSRQKSDSVYLPIIIHATNNLIAFIHMYSYI